MLPIFFHILVERERLEENHRVRNERKLLRDNSNPFNLPEARFIELFRLNKASVDEIEEVLRPHFQRSRYKNAVHPKIKILTALRFFATGSYQRSIGEDYNLAISQTVVHRCIHEVTDLINEHLTAIKIRFPQDRRTINENKQKFMEKFGFPGVLGCIDCTHVAILRPEQEEHNFINRKGYHSLNVQIICNSDMKILNINANFPGASHDSFIWRQSQIRNLLLHKYDTGELRGTWLLGDSGYPLEPILMVPFLENHANFGPGAQNYNRSLRQARSIIERCIGLLKMRFRCMLQERTARYNPLFMGKVVNCCAVLHNICIDRNILFEGVEQLPPPDLDQQGNINRDINQNMYMVGRQVRQTIINNYFDIN